MSTPAIEFIPGTAQWTFRPLNTEGRQTLARAMGVAVSAVQGELTGPSHIARAVLTEMITMGAVVLPQHHPALAPYLAPEGPQEPSGDLA